MTLRKKKYFLSFKGFSGFSSFFVQLKYLNASKNIIFVNYGSKGSLGILQYIFLNSQCHFFTFLSVWLF